MKSIKLVTIAVVMLATCLSTLTMYGQHKLKWNFPPPFRVLSPLPFRVDDETGFTRENDKINIEIKFNRPVDRSTVINNIQIGQTIRLECEKNTNAPIDLFWPDDQTLRITSKANIEDLLIFHPDTGFTLWLNGGPSRYGFGIQDKSGRYLDGDYDYQDGGSYNCFFRIIG